MSDTGMEAPLSRRDVLALALLAVAFLAAHQVGLRTITSASPLSPVWPPAGVALGAFLLLPRRTWWWAVGVIIASDAVSNALVGVRMWVGLSYLVASLAEVGVALFIIDRIAGHTVTFRRVRDTFALVVGAMLGALIGGGIAALIARWTAGAAIGQSFETWWTADVLGMLLVTPLIVAWTRGEPALRSVPIARATEGVLFLVFWSWASFLIFRGDITIGWLRPHPYMLASLMVWASFRLGIRGVSAAMTSVAIIAISVVLSGAKRFPLGDGTLAEHLFLVQVFLVIMGITGLLLASALDEGRAATEESRQYADRLKVLGDNLPNGVIYQLVEELDGSRHFLHVSASVERVNGLVAADVLRDASLMYNQIHEDDRARVAAAEEVSRRDLSVFSVETRIRRPDGQERWALISSTPRRAADGRTMWDGIQIDTTARRLAEDRLRRANRALRTISACNQVLVRATSEHELLHEICRVIVAEGGFRLAWVGYAEADEEKHVRPVAHFGYEAGYLESLDIRWNDSPRGRGPTGTTIRTGEPSICHDFLTDPSVAPWRHDAIARGYRASAVLPLRDQQRIFGTLSVYAPEAGAFDDEEMSLLAELADDLAFGLTALRAREERTLVEEALSASEERFRQLAENIREIFWMVDTRTGELLYISPGVERLYGLTVEEMQRDVTTRVERIHPEDRDRVLRGIDEVLRGGVFDDEHRVTHVAGDVHWVHGRAFPVRNESGDVYRIVGITDDITARKRIEEQLRQVQKLEAIGQLAGGVAHDFNNILGAILMQTGLARSLPGTNAEVSELLQDVEASAQRAANLTRQLLLFSRKQVMQPREVELNDLVATLTRMLRRVVPEHVQLKLAMHPRSLTVQADAGMLEQVVMNLTVNARDAMPDGGVLAIETFARTLTAEDCRPFPGTTPGVYNGVRVRDSGTGIAPELREHIFDPFFTTKEPGKGTGLGLPTVFGIVQQHRGVILVNSTVGQGSTFEILLPAHDVATPAVLPAIAAQPTPIPLRNATILVVEDDTSLRVMTQRILERHGFRVHTARSGREALNAWDRYEPKVDLLLTDMVMPEGVGGAELATTLQSRDPALRVVFSSGYDPEYGTHKLHLEPGVNFLQKPSTPRQIVEIVTQMLDGSESARGPASL